MIPNNLIVAGASAGGLRALSELVAGLHPDMDAAVVVVMHLPHNSTGLYVCKKLQPLTNYRCSLAEDGDEILMGHLYIAPADGHLLVKETTLHIGKGPQENRYKPSINVLFRSAAAAWSNHVIAIILTGLLDDGTAGMIAVKKSGGVTIVQDPDDAEYPDMPNAVLKSIAVDYRIPVAAMGDVLKTLTALPQQPTIPAPADVLTEASISERVSIGFNEVQQLGEQSIYACPDCGGGLFEIKDIEGNDRYRCHVGHAYSEFTLAHRQAEALESTLWVALRMMEERRNLLLKMKRSDEEKGFTRWLNSYDEKTTDLQKHVDNLKQILFSARHTLPPEISLFH